ncbi:glyoxalase [Streptomyces coelicoflavus]|uniref:glyoxalase n=1 Tax=Streptomyces coelicoflavus TaxID=285562 RepID=UPI00364636A2
MTARPAMCPAIPVDDPATARDRHGWVLGPAEGRSTTHWADWNFGGYRPRTRPVPTAESPAGSGLVDGHAVLVRLFRSPLEERRFQEFAEGPRAARVRCRIDPGLRLPGEPAGQWTMFFRAPADCALEVKSFRDEPMALAR